MDLLTGSYERVATKLARCEEGRDVCRHMLPAQRSVISFVSSGEDAVRDEPYW